MPALALSDTGGNGQDLASLLVEPLSSVTMTRPSSGLRAVDCENQPGIVIQDDGTIENGYGGNPAEFEEVRFVDIYTPEAYPARLTGVCVAFITISGEPTLDIDIVVYDDNGANGAPGALIDSLPATVDVKRVAVLPPPDQLPSWTTIDLSSLNIEVSSGSVFIGVRYKPPEPNVFLAADQSDDRPVGFAGGYRWTSEEETWEPIEAAFPAYRAMMVRPVLLTDPEAEISPASFSFTLDAGNSVSDQLTIANLADAGAQNLDWSMVMNCEDEPGIIIQDDGVVNNGYSGNPAKVTEARFVDRYTPASYPAVLESVCIGFVTLDGEPTLDLEIVVYDDSGVDGSPGQELGSLPATVDVETVDVPIPPGQQPAWTAIDLSPLHIEVSSGSLYVGVRMEPQDPNSFIAADENPDHPAGFAGGYRWFSDDEEWRQTQSQFPDYRALMIRPALMTEAQGCDAPEVIGWLNVSQDAGSVVAGDSVTVDVVFDADGLAEGLYQALLCLKSNDPSRPVIEIPVTMTVGDDAIFSDRFEQ